MRQGIFSISASGRTKTCRSFATTCGARRMAANPGWSAHRIKEQEEATSNGSPSIRPGAQDTVSNTRRTMESTVITTSSWNSNAPPMAESPGSLRSRFLKALYMDRSTWTRTAMFLLAEKGAPSTAFARAMHRLEARHRFLIR